MKRITLIFTALNDSTELIKTLESLYSLTDTSLFDVIVVNDGTQPKDWIELPKYDNLRLIEHRLRMGIHVSRDEAVNEANTQYIGIFNCRMRFEKDWLEKVLLRIEREHKTLFCTVSKILDEKGKWIKTKTDTGLRYGADILLYLDRPEAEWHNKNSKCEILPPKWRYEYTTDEIPCVMGAMYFCTKKWYQYIGGLEGLYSYGGDEQFLSLKTWMFGGKVKIIKEVSIANVYRKVKTYHDILEHYFYNTIYIGFVLLDIKTANLNLERLYDSPYYTLIQLNLLRSFEKINEIRNKYKKLTVNSINNFIKQ